MNSSGSHSSCVNTLVPYFAHDHLENFEIIFFVDRIWLFQVKLPTKSIFDLPLSLAWTTLAQLRVKIFSDLSPYDQKALCRIWAFGSSYQLTQSWIDIWGLSNFDYLRKSLIESYNYYFKIYMTKGLTRTKVSKMVGDRKIK